MPLEDVVDHQVTPHREADIQPAGEEDGQLGVTEGGPISALGGVLEDIRGNSPHLGEGGDIVLCGLVVPELLEVLPKGLRRLRHVDVAILTEDDGEAVVGFGDQYLVGGTVQSRRHNTGRKK